MRAYNSLRRNFKDTLTHFDYPGMMYDNNLIESFHSCIKPRMKLMKGFKKEENIDRYLKLYILAFRFKPMKESRLKDRRGKSPMQCANVTLPKMYNFISYLRKSHNLHFVVI